MNRMRTTWYLDDTIKAIHNTAKEKGVKPWTLGCYCYDCNIKFQTDLNSLVSFAKTGEPVSVGIEPAPLKDADGFLLDMNNPIVKNIWNAALEAAARVSEINSAANIRKLKK